MQKDGHTKNWKLFLGWHKVMESIDCALELGYNPVKVRDSDFNDDNDVNCLIVQLFDKLLWLIFPGELCCNEGLKWRWSLWLCGNDTRQGQFLINSTN